MISIKRITIKQKILTKKFHFSLCCTKFISSSASIIAELLLFDRDYTKCSISIFIRGGEVRYAVVLIVWQLISILVPGNCRRWISFYMAFQVHVILQRLAKSRTRSSDNWRKFNFQIDVSTSSSTNSIFCYAVVSPPIFFADWWDFKPIPPGNSWFCRNYNYVLYFQNEPKLYSNNTDK